MTSGGAKQSHDLKAPSRYRYLPLLLLALTCLGVSAYFFILTRNAETFLIEQEFKQAAQSRFTIQSRELQRHYAKTVSLAQLYTVSKAITREQFKTYVETFKPGLTDIQALYWIPRVLAEERSKYEIAARQNGLKEFQITERNLQGELVAAGARDEYYPVYYAEPYTGSEAALGFDLASEEIKHNALQQARDSGQMAATMKTLMMLGQEPLPSIIFFYPVYRHEETINTVAQRRQHLKGFFAGVSIYGGLSMQLFELFAPLDIDYYVFGRSSQQPVVNFHFRATQKVPIESSITPDALRVDLYQEATFKVDEVEMTLIAKPAPEFFTSRRGIRPWLLLSAGLAFFMSILVYIAVQINRLALMRQFAAEQAIANEKLAEANRELDAFVYTVSHDLRSPLTPIIGYADFLKESCSDRLDEQALGCLADISTAGEKMVMLMEDLLTLAKVGQVELPAEPFDTGAVVNEVVRALVSQFSRAEVAVEVSTLPPLRLPKTFLIQIFDNLIGNAVRYAGRRGSSIEVGGERKGDMVRLYVCDHGPGIPAEERSRIFEVFYRGATGKKSPGTGVGLATVQKIARLYKGRVWVEETKGGGSTFLVEMVDAPVSGPVK